MTEPEERQRYRRLPEPVPLEATVETVDASSGPTPETVDERARLLREAGAG
jgi:hypothetical protein